VGADWSAGRDLHALEAKIRRALPGEPWWKKLRWKKLRIGKLWPTLAVATAAVLVFVALPQRSAGTIEGQIVDNHVRSFLADHLVDVPSSDHHTVKPWFQGKLNFSPPVPDLAKEGFVLTGGRLDVIAGRRAAALIYKRREHVVNLWISPAEGPDTQLAESELEGFHLLHWQKDAMLYWAVSDLNPTELREFAMLIRSQ
jgi:anti-sigma factor RsiW